MELFYGQTISSYGTGEVAQMEKRFVPEKYGMMIRPVCNGQAHICSSDDARVCKHCGGFGLIREGKGKFTSY